MVANKLGANQTADFLQAHSGEGNIELIKSLSQYVGRNTRHLLGDTRDKIGLLLWNSVFLAIGTIGILESVMVNHPQAIKALGIAANITVSSILRQDPVIYHNTHEYSWVP